jgi:hypothetical protein
MVKLGSSIREAIAAVVERYDREGRSPRLDPASADSFQLHHSHFCLDSKPLSLFTNLYVSVLFSHATLTNGFPPNLPEASDRDG